MYQYFKDMCNNFSFQGVRTPFLTLQNLEVGDYTFTLKVKDAGGLESTADVHVYVKPGQYQQSLQYLCILQKECVYDLFT